MEILGPEVRGFLPAHLAETALFDDRADAGRRLAAAVPRDLDDPLVVGTTRGGVEIGAEVASALGAPLDAAIVAPVQGSAEYEYAVGAVGPGSSVYLQPDSGLSPAQSVVAVARAHREATRIDARLHEQCERLSIEGRDLVLVDEAITTGATMAAATAWAKELDASAVVAAVPVGASSGLELVQPLVDELICLYEFEVIGARAVWFGDFPRLADDEVRHLLEATR